MEGCQNLDDRFRLFVLKHVTSFFNVVQRSVWDFTDKILSVQGWD